MDKDDTSEDENLGRWDLTKNQNQYKFILLYKIGTSL